MEKLPQNKIICDILRIATEYSEIYTEYKKYWGNMAYVLSEQKRILLT